MFKAQSQLPKHIGQVRNLSWHIADTGGDPEVIQNLSGRFYYRLARCL